MTVPKRASLQIFTQTRLWWTGALLLGLYLIYFTSELYHGRWILDQSGRPLPVDFSWIWTGARFALARDAIGAFDYNTFSAAQAPLTGPAVHGVPYYYWIYPPIFLLFIAPLGYLPYVLAYVCWIVITASAYLRMIYTIIPRYLTVLISMLPINVAETIYIGHTGFFLTSILGFSLILCEQQPFVGGIVLGFLIYKPQFCMLFPVVLLAAGQWRIIIGFAVSAITLVATSSAVFGIQSWVLFFKTIRKTDPNTFMPDARLDAMNQTVFGFMHWLGAPLATEWFIYVIVVIPAVLLASAIWRRDVAFSLKAAVLSLGTLVVTPYMLSYDLVAVTIPAAFLIKDGLASGFLPGEEAALIVCFGGLALTSIIPAGPAVMAILFVLLLRRVASATRQEYASAVHQQSRSGQRSL